MSDYPLMPQWDKQWKPWVSGVTGWLYDPRPLEQDLKAIEERRKKEIMEDLRITLIEESTPERLARLMLFEALPTAQQRAIIKQMAESADPVVQVRRAVEQSFKQLIEDIVLNGLKPSE